MASAEACREVPAEGEDDADKDGVPFGCEAGFCCGPHAAMPSSAAEATNAVIPREIILGVLCIAGPSILFCTACCIRRTASIAFLTYGAKYSRGNVWAGQIGCCSSICGMVLRCQRHLTEDKSLRKDRIVTGIVVEFGAYL